MSEKTLELSLVDLPRALGSHKAVHVDLAAPADLGTAWMGVDEGALLGLDIDLTSVDDGVLVRLRTEVTLRGECVRCLDPVVRVREVDASEVFFEPSAVPKLIDEGGDASDLPLIGPRDTVDVETLLRDAVVPLAEDRPLCSPDCEGLCQGCGERWEDLPDNHEHVSIDPRLASLAALLGDRAVEPEVGLAASMDESAEEQS